jgi:myo-inositol-1(or 4)-monophosphatase
MADVMEVAQAAALEGGRSLKATWGKARVLKKKSGIRDLLTQADLEAEERLVAVIRAAFPEHHIWGEEGGRLAGAAASSHCWILDPLDGTTNYLHQVPYCCVSVACLEGQQVTAAVVYAPFQDELFAAARGGGASLNGSPVCVSEVDRLEESLLATGFPTSPDIPLNPHLDIFGTLLQRAQGVRRPGAAALNLAYVACGRFDAFWGTDLKPWDIAAGMLLTVEAGGRVNGYQEEHGKLFPTKLLASNGHIHLLLEELLGAFE